MRVIIAAIAQDLHVISKFSLKAALAGLICFGFCACNRFVPTDKSISGKWVAVENTTSRFAKKPYSTHLIFKDDKTFIWHMVDPQVISYGNVNGQKNSSLISETTGTWGIYKDGLFHRVRMSTALPDHGKGVTASPIKLMNKRRLRIKGGGGEIIFRKSSE